MASKRAVIFSVSDIHNLQANVNSALRFAEAYMHNAGISGGNVYRKSPGVRAQVHELRGLLTSNASELRRLAASLEAVFSDA